MSMDEMLLQELYGSQEVQAEEEIKQAQVELVEAVAAEAGVDLNELSDDELQKFAHYVLSDEDEEVISDDSYEEKIAEADLMGRQMAHSYLDELNSIQEGEEIQVKVASAMEDVAEYWHMQKEAEERDNSARNAAIGATLAGGAMAGGAMAGKRIAKSRLGAAQKALGTARAGAGAKGKAMLSKLEADQAALSRAKSLVGHSYGDAGGGRGSTAARLQKAMEGRQSKMKRVKASIARSQAAFDASDKAKELQSAIDARKNSKFQSALRGLSGKQMAALGVGGAALGGGAAYLMSRKKKQQKKTAAFLDAGYEALAIADLYEPEEFAKEAELRAAEILAANGVHPETFEDIQPQEIKLASFPGVEDASDLDEAEALQEYNDMLDEAALHIIDELLD